MTKLFSSISNDNFFSKITIFQKKKKKSRGINSQLFQNFIQVINTHPHRQTVALNFCLFYSVISKYISQINEKKR